MISSEARASWERWISVTRSRCHLHFVVEGGTIDAHVAVGMAVGRRCAQRLAEEIGGSPSKILEVGCSVGFNCIGLAERFPDAQVFGIEPDADAVQVATAMARDMGLSNVNFMEGVGESLPMEANTFDWIVCHTVIEHVRDVGECIREMSRVLHPGGVIHLEAPNYLWPHEPHLDIVMPPLCPKPLMRILAHIQGKADHAGYAEHLQLVHPGWIEKEFRRNGLAWTNRVESKLKSVTSGDSRKVVSYRRGARLISFLGSVGLDGILVKCLMLLRLYPSILYTAKKPLASV